MSRRLLGKGNEMSEMRGEIGMEEGTRCKVLACNGRRRNKKGREIDEGASMVFGGCTFVSGGCST
jgi:uncharacterized protein Veg